MARKRKSSSRKPSASNRWTPPRRITVSRETNRGWDPSWTLARLRMSQTNPFVKLIPSSLRDTRQSSRPQTFAARDTSRRQPFVYVDKGGILIDARSGEIMSAKRVAERLQQDDCRKARNARRHSIISSGHGGRNGVREYSKHKEC